MLNVHPYRLEEIKEKSISDIFEELRVLDFDKKEDILNERKTKQLKELMWNHQEQYDRVGVLKDVFKGENDISGISRTTFNQFSSEKLNEVLKDELVLSIKQTQHFTDDITDFHLLNFCNLTKYKYNNPNTIVGWRIWDESQPYTIIENFQLILY